MLLAAQGRRESVCVHDPEPLQAFELYYFTYLVFMLVDSSRNQNLINIALCVDGLVHMLVSHGHLSSLRAAAARGPAARAPRHRVGSLAGRATPVVSKHATENAGAVQSLPGISVYLGASISRSSVFIHWPSIVQSDVP